MSTAAIKHSPSPLGARFSLGLLLSSDDNTVVDVVPGSSADKAGIGPNMKIVAINGRKFSDALLKDALGDSKQSKPVELLVENATYYSTVKLEYQRSHLHPHLERVEGTTDYLTRIIEPRAK